MPEEYLILVDKKDNPLGLEEKVKCHISKGKLHRAFTVLLFNEEGKILLTKRSQNKMLWPGCWDGSVASHPRKSESYVSSSERRLAEEVGISCRLDYLFKFEYHVPFKNIGSENEICGTLIGIIKSKTSINFVKEEISEIKWIESSELVPNLQKFPENYCPWMLVALYLLPSADDAKLTKYQSILSNWMNSEIKTTLERSIKYHFPDKKWRLVN